MDVRINTADDLSTSDKNLVNFGEVNSEFCRRVSAGRATRWALPRIYSINATCCTKRYVIIGARWHFVQ